jgi:hypothetical protein
MDFLKTEDKLISHMPPIKLKKESKEMRRPKSPPK